MATSPLVPMEGRITSVVAAGLGVSVGGKGLAVGLGVAVGSGVAWGLQADAIRAAMISPR